MSSRAEIFYKARLEKLRIELNCIASIARNNEIELAETLRAELKEVAKQGFNFLKAVDAIKKDQNTANFTMLAANCLRWAKRSLDPTKQEALKEFQTYVVQINAEHDTPCQKLGTCCNIFIRSVATVGGVLSVTLGALFILKPFVPAIATLLLTLGLPALGLWATLALGIGLVVVGGLIAAFAVSKLNAKCVLFSGSPGQAIENFKTQDRGSLPAYRGVLAN